MDFDRELQFVKKVVDSSDSKNVLLHYSLLEHIDTGRQKTYKRDLQIILVDLETSFYRRRMIDFGEYFKSRMFDLSKKTNKSSGLPYPSGTERRCFMKTYLPEYQRLSPQTVDPDIDNQEQLHLEAEIGSLFSSLSSCCWILRMWYIFRSDPWIFLCLKFYLESKATIATIMTESVASSSSS